MTHGDQTLKSKPAPRDAVKSLKRLASGFVCCVIASLGMNSLHAAPFIYVANNGDDTVSVIDAATGGTAAVIPVGLNPVAVVLNPAGTKAYVTNFNSEAVSVIDTATNTVTGGVTVGNEPELLAISADGASLYVVNTLSQSVSFIDTASLTQTTTVSVPGFPVGIAVAPAGDFIYVTEANLSKVAVISVASKTVTATIDVGENPIGIILNQDGTKAYVANYQEGSVSVIDIASATVVATVPVGAGPDAIAINPAGTFIYVVNYASDSVSVIDTTSNTVVATMPAGINPFGISIDSNGAYAYVSSSFVDMIYVLDLSVNTFNGTFSTGVLPTYSAITSSAALSVNLDQHGLTGAWYDSSTSGQGMFVETYPDISGPGQGVLSVGWFTYDVTAAGGQRWYTLQGSVNNTDPEAALTIYSTTGGNFDAGPVVHAAPVGQATLRFSDCIHGFFTYTFSDGSNRTGFVPITRLTANTTCAAAGDNGAAASDYLLSGAWYNPATSGQGLIFDVNPAQTLLAAAWYAYAPTGQQIGGGASQRWYTLQDGAFTAGSTSATGVAIFETTGGVFHDPTPVTRTQVGTADVAFQSCNSLTVAYNFTAGTNQGLSGTMNLVRVGSTPAGCSL